MPSSNWEPKKKEWYEVRNPEARPYLTNEERKKMGAQNKRRVNNQRRVSLRKITDSADKNPGAYASNAPGAKQPSNRKKTTGGSPVIPNNEAAKKIKPSNTNQNVKSAVPSTKDIIRSVLKKKTTR